ncbi:hypothetical protein BC940DRAFT_287357 [Gongronella butleri]|nr:hypothetical protein BC940DRAFT_287357 [Gongronella butleri]
MTDKTEHRFVAVQRAIGLVGDDMGAFWQALGHDEQGLSLLALSHACDQLTRDGGDGGEVSTREATVQQVHNALLVCKDGGKEAVLVSCLFDLFRRRFEARPGERLVSLLSHRPELFHEVIAHVHAWLEEDPAAFGLFSPLFDYILLSPPGRTQIDAHTLLFRWTRLLYASSLTPSILSAYLVSACKRYPWHYAMEGYVALVDLLLDVERHAGTNEHADALVYMTLERALDAATHGQQVVTPLLRTLRRLFSENETIANVGVLAAGLSALLMAASTMRDQVDTLKLLRACLDRSDAPLSRLYWVALLPLFQTLAECQQGPAAIRNDILALIDKLPALCDDKAQQQDITIEMSQVLATHEIAGALAHVISMATLYVSDSAGSIPVDGDGVTLLMSMPAVFSTDDGIAMQAARAIVHQAGSLQPSPKWPILLTFMYLLRQRDLASVRLQPLFLDAIPALAHVNDPVITTKTLQLTLSMIQYRPATIGVAPSSTALTHLGVKALTRLFDHQPRIWPELRKVLADWALRVSTASFTAPRQGDLETDMAILATMRHLCTRHADTCATDILPMVIAWLQAARYVHCATLALAVQILAACVRANLAEPRSLWLVAVSHIAKLAHHQPIASASLLLRRLCEWMAIVGERDEVSEPYLDFKQSVLSEYLVPWTEVSDAKVRGAAFRALAQFPMADVLPFLPEKPKEWLQSMGDDLKVARPLLQSLVSHELDHLQRRMFDASSAKASKKAQEDDNDDNCTKSEMPAEDAMARSLIGAWEQARVAPGVRSGHALALLAAVTSPAQALDQQKAAPAANLPRAKWYRCMTTALTDASLTDHLLIRISSANTWHAFFDTALAVDTDARATFIYNDLVTRLEKTTVPGLACNLWMALTGFMSALYQRIPSRATSFATEVWKMLTTQYLCARATRTSDEVQFGARFCAGQLTKYVVVDDKLAQQLWEVLWRELQAYATDAKDETVSWTAFATGHAVGSLLSTLLTWPTPTAVMETLGQYALSELLPLVPRLTPSATLGWMIACAPFSQHRAMTPIVALATDNLTAFVQGYTEPDAQVYGAMWVAAYAAYTPNATLDANTIMLVHAAAAMATKKNVDEAMQFHFEVPVGMVSHWKSLVEGKSETQSVDQALNAALSGDASALFVLGVFSGVDYLQTCPSMWQLDLLAKEAGRYQKDRPIVSAMANIAGLDASGSPSGQLKVVRIATVLCGHIIRVTVDALAAKTQLHAPSSSNASPGGRTATSSSSSLEPSDYQRLNNNTSFLRALFDMLVAVIDDAENENFTPVVLRDVVQPILTCLRDVAGPLPPVNWFPVLRSLSRLGVTLGHPAISRLCFAFASKHAQTSQSLSEYLLQELTRIRFITSPSNSKYPALLLESIVSPTGMGKLLALSGLPAGKNNDDSDFQRRGTAAVMRKIQVSPVRALSILLHYCHSFWHWPEEYQVQWLTTLQQHVCCPAKDEAARLLMRDIQDKVRDNVTDALLSADESRAVSLRVSRLAVAVSLRSVDDLLQGKTLAAWLAAVSSSSATVSARIQALLTVQPSKLTDALGALASVPADSAVWAVMADALAQNAKNRLSWVVRLLDVLIVAAATADSDTDTSTVTLDAAARGIYMGLVALWSGVALNDASLAMADTGYYLSTSLALATDTDAEQQIMRRLARLVTLVPASPLNDMLVQVIRCAPRTVLERQWQQVQPIIITVESQ